MFEITLTVLQLFVVVSQRTTFPVSPLSVKVPELSPKQTLVASLVRVPPVLTSSTVIVTSLEVASEHTPD